MGVFLWGEGEMMLKEKTKTKTTKFTRLQVPFVDFALTTELVISSTRATAEAAAVVVEEQQQQQQQQQGERRRQQRVVVKPKRTPPKNVMKGFHSRDEIDLSAQILEVVARQDLMVLAEARKDAFRRGTRRDFRINRNGVISLNFIRRIIHISDSVLYPYVVRLIRCGLMEIHNITFKRDSIKKIPIITDKGRQFLQVYREIKGMLSTLFSTNNI